MILDNEQQRKLLLEMFKQINFPGDILEVAYAVKKAIGSATVAETIATQQAEYDKRADAR